MLRLQRVAWRSPRRLPRRRRPARPAAGHGQAGHGQAGLGLPSPRGFAAVVKQATAAREANDLDKAVELYKRALALKPDWTEGWWNLGTACYDLDRFAEANDAFRRVLAKDDPDGVTWAFKGLTSFQLKHYDEALSGSDGRRGRRGVIGQPRDRRGGALPHRDAAHARTKSTSSRWRCSRDFGLEGNDSPRIIEAMGLATLRLPMLPDDLPGTRRELVMLAGRAQYFMAARLLQASQNAFEALASRYPDTPNVHYAYGVLLAGEQPEQAIERFKRELKVSPQHVLAKIQIAFALHQAQRVRGGASPGPSRRCRKRRPQFVAHNALGQVLLETGDVEGADARARERRQARAGQSGDALRAGPRLPARRPRRRRRSRAGRVHPSRSPDPRAADRRPNSVGGMAPPKCTLMNAFRAARPHCSSPPHRRLRPVAHQSAPPRRPGQPAARPARYAPRTSTRPP